MSHHKELEETREMLSECRKSLGMCMSQLQECVLEKKECQRKLNYEKSSFKRKLMKLMKMILGEEEGYGT